MQHVCNRVKIVMRISGKALAQGLAHRKYPRNIHSLSSDIKGPELTEDTEGVRALLTAPQLVMAGLRHE